jgi:hypothetical protein
LGVKVAEIVSRRRAFLIRMWRMWLRALFVMSCLAASAQAGTEDVWLDALYARVAADLNAGRPLVVQVHAPLCDNRILRCGNRRIGDGDDSAENLYWGTDEGFVGWFERKGSGWTLALRTKPGGDVIEERVWRRSFAPGPRWRALGVRRPFWVYVVATAWRGTSIDVGLAAFVADLFGGGARAVRVGDVDLAAGGAAQIVAYVGHNRWMDYVQYDWATAARRAGVPGAIKGTIAVACDTTDYLAAHIAAPERVPLVLTTDLMFAAAGSFEGTVRAFAEGGDYAAMRGAAADGYAASERKPLARVRGLFTNPGDPRWRRYFR